MSGTHGGYIAITAEMTMFDDLPYINIMVSNSKYVLHKKNDIKLHQVTQERDFTKILESHVDLNVILAKVISN
jgi:hypothetical protein